MALFTRQGLQLRLGRYDLNAKMAVRQSVVHSLLRQLFPLSQQFCVGSANFNDIFVLAFYITQGSIILMKEERDAGWHFKLRNHEYREQLVHANLQSGYWRHGSALLI